MVDHHYHLMSNGNNTPPIPVVILTTSLAHAHLTCGQRNGVRVEHAHASYTEEVKSVLKIQRMPLKV